MVLSPFQSFTPPNNIGFKPNSASKVGSRAETASKRQLSVTSIDEETPALPDAKGSFLSFREGIHAVQPRADDLYRLSYTLGRLEEVEL